VLREAFCVSPFPGSCMLAACRCCACAVRAPARESPYLQRPGRVLSHSRVWLQPMARCKKCGRRRLCTPESRRCVVCVCVCLMCRFPTLLGLCQMVCAVCLRSLQSEDGILPSQKCVRHGVCSMCCASCGVACLGVRTMLYSNTPRSFLPSLQRFGYVARCAVCCSNTHVRRCRLVAARCVAWRPAVRMSLGMLAFVPQFCTRLSLFGATTLAPLRSWVFFCPQQDVHRTTGAHSPLTAACWDTYSGAHTHTSVYFPRWRGVAAFSMQLVLRVCLSTQLMQSFCDWTSSSRGGLHVCFEWVSLPCASPCSTPAPPVTWEERSAAS
jgi:hypothetical protein